MGRPRGSSNTIDSHTKMLMRNFCRTNASKFQEYLDEIEKVDGKLAAGKLLLEIFKYAMPVAKDDIPEGGVIINVTTGIPAPPNTRRPLRVEGKILIDEDGEPIYDD